MSHTNETLAEIIERLGLERHVEGGWFRETYRSDEKVNCPDRAGISRSILTTIHYLLDSSQPYGAIHKNRSDIIHFHEGGGALKYLTVSPAGELEEHILGSGYDRQLVVPGGYWKATELLDGEWGMVGEAVSPGFDFQDMEIDDGSWIRANFPQHYDRLTPYYKKA